MYPAPVVSLAVLTTAAAVAAGQVPVFSNSLDDAVSSTVGGGVLQGSAPSFVPGAIGNAFQSTNNSYIRWNNAAVQAIFGGWNNGAGITVDYYFRGDHYDSHSGDEGHWSVVKRSGGDHYFICSVRNGYMRHLFGLGSTATQYKYHLDWLPLSNNTIYRCTVRQLNGAFEVYLDDIGGSQYSNDAPVFSATDLPVGYTWPFVTSSSDRVMDIGNRGAFGGTLQAGDWVDHVRIFNGYYSPAELDAGGLPVALIQADKTSGRPPLTIQFDGSASYDTDGGTIVRYDWDFDNDGVVDSTAGAIVSHVYESPGDFICKLTVADNENKVGSAVVSIHVLYPEIVPVTALSPSGGPLSGSQVLTSVTADGYTITDLVGPTTVELDGSVDNTANRDLCDIGSEHYRAMLGLELGRGIISFGGGDTMLAFFPPGVAVSGDGTPAPDIFVLEYATSSDDFLVHLLTNEPGQWPAIAFTVQVTKGDYGATATRMTAFNNAPVGGVGIDLDAIGVSGIRGIEIPDWNGIDGFTGIDPCVIAARRPSGMTFPPVAVIRASPTSGGAPLPVAFDASCGSYDPDGDLSYAWDFTDDGTADATGLKASHTYTATGAYTARLTVTDADNLTASDTALIDIAGMNPKRRIVAMVPAGNLPAGSYPLASVTTEYPGGMQTFTETNLAGPPDTAHVEIVGSMTGSGAGATTPAQALVGLELGSTVSGLNAASEYLTAYFADDLRVRADGTAAPEIFLIEDASSEDDFQVQLLTTGPGQWPEQIVATVQIFADDYGATSTVIGSDPRGGVGLDLDALGVTDIRGVRVPGLDGLGGVTGVDPVVIAARATQCNRPPQDVDGDGDVDVADFGVFQICFNGPGNPWPTFPESERKCPCMDDDQDGDVDVNDFAVFQRCFNGPGQPPACQ